MNLSPEDFDSLKSLEESMWRSETRFSKDHMDRVLSPSFIEFGRSGRRYQREESLHMVRQEIRAKLPLDCFEINLIKPDVALITYVSEVQYETLERANRCSIWVRNSSTGWQLRFHQGTPISQEILHLSDLV